MHITNQEQLNKQKRKLSMWFTFILFVIVLFLQVVFLIWRYLNYSNRNIQSLENDVFKKHKQWENIISEKVWNLPQMPMFEKEWRWRRLKWWNVIVYNSKQNVILSSSLWDEEFSRELLQQLLKEKDSRWKISYNKSKFLFVKWTINAENQSFFLFPLQIGISDVIKDILLFILFLSILSVLFYRVIYWFVWRLSIPIQENIQDMEQFIFNAWHELKTPLSVTKSHLQLALVKKQYKDPIDASIKEIDKMNTLLDTLINLSVLNQETEKNLIDVSQEVENIVTQYSEQIQKNKISINIKKNNICFITANKWHVNMLISNILSNAIKYNKKGWSVEIEINSWILIIKDTGVGIEKKEIDNIFDRFYQVGNVRNQDWFGIGLALVKKIVDIYWWKITTISQEKKWTTFEIRFL